MLSILIILIFHFFSRIIIFDFLLVHDIQKGVLKYAMKGVGEQFVMMGGISLTLMLPVDRADSERLTKRHIMLLLDKVLER